VQAVKQKKTSMAIAPKPVFWKGHGPVKTVGFIESLSLTMQ
jgi:hypothetical protein